MPTPADFRPFLDTLTESLELYRAQRQNIEGVLHGQSWVLSFDNGLYVEVKLSDSNRVESVVAVGVAYASRLTKADATNLARNGNIRNGAGQTARPLPVRDALDHEIAQLEQLIGTLEARMLSLPSTAN